MIIRTKQDPKYYAAEDLIPDGTKLKVVGRSTHFRALTAVFVMYKKRKIRLWTADVEIISN